jgi:MFS family permease
VSEASSHLFVLKNVFVLAASQALSMSGMSMVMTASALAGHMMTEDKSLATIPMALQFAAAMITTIPASLFMGRFGRRVGFSIGQTVGACGASLAAFSIFTQSFWLFCTASLLLGFHVAFWQYYRFAAADSVNQDFKAKAISYVLAGGVVASILGPELAKFGEKLLEPVLFSGVYVIIAGLCVATLFLIQAIQIPTPTKISWNSKSGRSILKIMRQPTFIVAVMSGMLGYGTMTFVMIATPLAMNFCGFSFADSATVIQWHVFAMFSPSFFTGNLIKRFGVLNIILAGVLLISCAITINLSGIEFLNFTLGLICLGLGWNFMFIGGTTLMTEAYTPDERAKTQAANDFIILSITTIAAFSSGAIQHSIGWTAVNVVAIIPMSSVFAAVIWFKFIYIPNNAIK